ncbi:MAG: ATP-binding protein [Halobacteriota archaeon]
MSAQFKTRARAVEMLGKDQIANAPTAISELFKNAYDAYATKVSVDLYPEDDTLVLWDDGIGMSEEDVSEKWLVVGTGDKKKRDPRQFLRPGEVKSEFLEREIMGEKGIGRLAISVIGKQLFLFSHRLNEKIICLFVDWRIFQHLDLNLDEVRLPTRILNEGQMFTRSRLLEMLQEFRDNFENPKWKSEPELKQEILTDLENLDKNLNIEEIIKTPAFGAERGTTFYISALEDDFKNIEISNPKATSQIFETRLFRLLLGFRNALLKNPPDMNYSFFIHRKGRPPFNVLTEREWWNRDDLKVYDHLIEGEFDDFGRFVGRCEIFGESVEYVNLWKKGRKTKCGPIEVCIRYVEGEYKSSRLEGEDYSFITSKLGMIGGLYVYRGGIRVLPYGEADVDFLEFEERRSKGAARYFFSHRRFFGYIAITKKNNKNLRDKASREGFIDNAAYRDFTDVLKQFFIDIAADHFYRERAKKSDLHFKLTEQHRIEKKALEEEEKRTKQEKKQFLSLLQECQQTWENGLSLLEENTISSIKELHGIQEEITTGHFREIEEKIASVTKDYKKKQRQVLHKYSLEKPDRLALNDGEEGDYAEYLTIFEHLKNKAEEFDVHFYDEVGSLLENLRSIIDREKILREEIHKTDLEIQESLTRKKEKLEKHMSGVKELIFETFQHYYESIEPLVLNKKGAETLGELVVSADRGAFQETLTLIDEEGKIRLYELEKRYSEMSRQLQSFSREDSDERLIGAQKKLMEEQREKLSLYHNLAQLGLAVEIIDHELEMLYQNIKFQLGLLSGYRRDEKLRTIYEDLKYGFQHLESKHKLMLPLYRKSLLKKKTIKGKEIYDYLLRFFEETIKGELNINASESFRNIEIPNASETILYPAFINLVNNSIYWTKESEVREIFLDYRNGIIYVEDTGIGIGERDKYRIFKPFFSRKKEGGRGLGLYITRENLRANGYDIDFTLDSNEKTKSGACFKIYLSKMETGGEE